MSILRSIVNRLHGRKFESENELSLDQLFILLHNAELLDAKVTKAKFCSDKGWHNLKETAYGYLREFLERSFETHVDLGTPHYTSIRHQVYSSDVEEAHYIDIDQGELSFENCETRKEKPKRRASIEYLVEKEEVFVI